MFFLQIHKIRKFHLQQLFISSGSNQIQLVVHILLTFFDYPIDLLQSRIK